MVTQQVGHGKVAMMLSDRTWRLREGAGDVHHHRFWGQLVRWGAGPILRAGTRRVRLGTDALSYTADDEIRITARLRDGERNPVRDESLQAELWREGQKISTVGLAYVDGSNGLHEGRAGPFQDPGRLEVRLVGEKASEMLHKVGLGQLAVGVRILGARSPVELSETTLNRPLVEAIGALSGGRVVEPAEAGSLASLFLAGDGRKEELRETRLWNHWVLLLVFGAILTTEWVLRRGSGLP